MSEVQSVPRYTSYPTANHFSAAVGPADYAAWLRALPRADALSVYVHIPYCRELCLYCGCTTEGVRRHAVLDAYLEALTHEIATVARLLPDHHQVRYIHWGGGSPDVLEPQDMADLAGRLWRCLQISPGVEFAAEIDPRGLSAARADALAAAGLTRASFGVQDFAPQVQRAIGRWQSFATTEWAVRALRDRGVRSVNLDLVYGLPSQTVPSVSETARRVIELDPDRIAVFGYAHLPARAPRQRHIDAALLPDGPARAAQRHAIDAVLRAAGYVPRGLDHYAKPTDALATAPLRRNFQGYTTDQADALIGLGASAISCLPGGYAQNAPRVHAYKKAVAETGLATARGAMLNEDDQARGFAIERILCDFALSRTALRARFGASATSVEKVADAVLREAEPGWLNATDDGFQLTEAGQPYARLIAARFDSYFEPEGSTTRHAPVI